MQREQTFSWLPCARSKERTAARQRRMPVTGLPGLQILDEKYGSLVATLFYGMPLIQHST
jgi:hypothetical protein